MSRAQNYLERLKGAPLEDGDVFEDVGAPFLPYLHIFRSQGKWWVSWRPSVHNKARADQLLDVCSTYRSATRYIKPKPYWRNDDV